MTFHTSEYSSWKQKEKHFLLNDTWKSKEHLQMFVLSFHLSFWYIILQPISHCQQYSGMLNSNRTLSYPTVGKTTHLMQKEKRGEVGPLETPPVWVGVWRHHWLTDCRLLHSRKTLKDKNRCQSYIYHGFSIHWLNHDGALSRLLVWCGVGFNDHLCLLTGWYIVQTPPQ
jgi:hypothetical protein